MKKLVLVVITGILIFSGFRAGASHIAGCDLSYTCIGGNDYLITLTFYRDCSGVTEPTNVAINFTSSCGSFSVTLNKLPPITGVEVTPVCPGQVTTCGGGTLYGLQRFIYQGQVTLTPCSDWTMSYQLCCRNPSNTIQSPSSADMYIPATLNNLAAPCNSSPTFSNAPATIICNGQQFCFNHGAIDPDGDSLVYSLVTPYDDGPGGAQPNVIYLGGYTPQQPLPSSPPVTMDPSTGDICMTPTQNITTVFAVLVQEWRTINGVPTLIGTVLRDMQLTVVTCSNQLPTIGGINPNATQYNPNDTIYALDVCLGDTVQFNIYSYDSDNPLQNLTMSWNNGIPDAVWSVTGNGTPNVVGHFFWVPTSSYISNVPYCFTVSIQDDNCPYVGTQTFSYCLTIGGLRLDLNLPTDTLMCMGESFIATASHDTNAINFYWYVDGVLTTPINDSTFLINTVTLGPGDHTVVVNADNGILTQCPGIDYINVKVVPLPVVNLGPDTIICQGQTYTLDGGPGAQYFWTPGNQTTQTIGVTTTGTYIVEVDGGQNTRCKDYDTVFVKVLQLPVVDLGPDLCVEDTVTLNAGNTGFEYHWNTGASSQTILVDHTGTYSVTVAEELGHNCDVTDDVYVRVLPVPDLTIGPDSTVCQHQSIEIKARDRDPNFLLTDYDYTYAWTLDDDPYGQTDPFIVLSWLPGGQHTIVGYVMGCELYADTMILTVELCELTIPNIITPNGDSQNDKFRIPNLEYYPNSELFVYNRWGRKVYESSNYQNDWDGTGHSDGVYFFLLRVNYGNAGNGEQWKEFHGTLTILR